MGTCGEHHEKPNKKNASKKYESNDKEMKNEIKNQFKKNLKEMEKNKMNNNINKAKDQKLYEKRDDKNLLKKYNIRSEENENKFFCDETTKTDKKLAYEFYENNTNINDNENFKKDKNKKEINGIICEPQIKKETIITKYKNIMTLEGHTEKVTSLIQLASDKLVSGSYDNTLCIWDINDSSKQKPEKRIQEQGRPLFILEFEKNKILTATSNNQINLWNLNNDPINLEYTFEGHELWINCLVKIDYQKFASASNDAMIIIWDYNNRKIISTLEGHEDCILTLIILKNGKLCSGGADQFIKIWDIEKYTCIQTLYSHEKWVKCLLELNNDIILSGSDDKTIKLWKYNTKENKYDLFKTLLGHNHSVRTLCQIDDNHFASGSFDCTIKIWEINNWNCIETLIGHSSIIIWMININFKGKNIIASCSDDKSIKLWEKCKVEENNDDNIKDFNDKNIFKF
jgi:WD40 repeat protein